MKKAKKITKIVIIGFIVMLLLIILLFFIPSKLLEDKVISSLGEYKKREYFTSGGFQDYTDYAKYYYTTVNITENIYFEKIEEDDFETINIHLDDFEMWIEAHKESDPSKEVVVNYDFNRDIIDVNDYIYIDSEEHTWNDGHTSLVNYNIYFFDTQTNILYYFHNNI